jgi:hypothetical protein
MIFCDDSGGDSYHSSTNAYSPTRGIHFDKIFTTFHEALESFLKTPHFQ